MCCGFVFERKYSNVGLFSGGSTLQCVVVKLGYMMINEALGDEEKQQAKLHGLREVQFYLALLQNH